LRSSECGVSAKTECVDATIPAALPAASKTGAPLEPVPNGAVIVVTEP
jgi:hypothetical protein